MFMWVIQHCSYYESTPIKIGKDLLDYLLFHWNDLDLYIRGAPPNVIIPYINIDSTQSMARLYAIKQGLYFVVAHWHKSSMDIQKYEAFHVLRPYFEFMQQQISENYEYYNPYRKNLEMTDNTYVDYINVHKTGDKSDGSGGCLTMLSQYFHIFRSAFYMCEKGILYLDRMKGETS